MYEVLKQQLAAGQVFGVDEVEPGVYQSVFPEIMAEYSSLHSTKEDAWGAILDAIGEVMEF